MCMYNIQQEVLRCQVEFVMQCSKRKASRCLLPLEQVTGRLKWLKMVSSLSMKLIKYQSVFRLMETSTEHDPKVVTSVCPWKLQVVCFWGHSFTLAVKCPLRLGAGMRCWPHADTADQWQGRAATPQGHFQRSPVRASVPATAKHGTLRPWGT